MTITGLNLRSRAFSGIRRGLAALLERAADNLLPAQPPASTAPAAVEPTPPQSQAAPTPPQELPKPPPATQRDPARTPGLTSAGRAAIQSPEDRAEAHRARVREGLLRFVDEQGGRVSLHDLHNHSATSFLVSHKAFSDMMESLVDQDLLDYDADASTATLTTAGHAAIQA